MEGERVEEGVGWEGLFLSIYCCLTPLPSHPHPHPTVPTFRGTALPEQHQAEDLGNQHMFSTLPAVQ